MAQKYFITVALSVAIYSTFGVSMIASSVVEESPCSSDPCIKGQECFLKATNCSNPPCPLVASCRPSCEVIRCRSGTYCINGKCVTSCAEVECDEGEICVLEDVACFTAPCPPMPTCIDKCAIVRCQSGYTCYRGKCYKEPTCVGFHCKKNEECYLQNVTCVQAPCFPVPACRPILTCATINCLSGYVCVDRKCVPEPTCDGYRCGPNEECYLQDVNCIRAPCFPVPACRPILTCATIKCPGGYTCEDNKCIPPPTCDTVDCGPGQQCYLESKPCYTAPCPPPEPVCRGTCANILCATNTMCVNGQCRPIGAKRRKQVFFYL